MAIYGITGVHINENGYIERVCMQPINSETNEMAGTPMEYEVHEAANSIATGDVIYSVFIIDDGVAIGPKFKIETYGQGGESIMLEEDIEGKRAQDLLQF